MADFAVADEIQGMRFNTHGGDSELNHRSGERIFVIEQIDPSTYDFEDIGPMYRVEFEDGTVISAFEDEIEEW